MVAISRRSFLSGIAAGALILCLDVRPGATEAAWSPSVFVSIDETGRVAIVAHRSEMGQGIRTFLPLAVADEMEADWAQVDVVQADGDEPRYGSQNTDGSKSVRDFLLPMRQIGATVRTLLEAAAAATWQVPASEVAARLHTVVHRPSGRSLAFGALVATARTLPMPSQVVLKDRSAFRYMGKDMPAVDLRDITTGHARYGMDATVPGLRYAVVARPPVFGGKVRTVDARAALKVPGVERVVTLPTVQQPPEFHPLGGVAVVARSTWAALQGREQLKITWDDGPNHAYDSKAYAALLHATAQAPGQVVRDQGDAPGALAAAHKVVRADYYAPHLAHAPMEPPVALAHYTDGKCEVWAPSQEPQDARDEVAKALGLKADAVTVHVTLLGGGFGRKSKPDYVVEAALVSKAAGVPIKLMWSREDEIQHDYYHTASAQHLEAALDDRGHVTAWLHRTVFPSISTTFAADVHYGSPGEMGMGVTDVPFDIPNLRCENGPADAHVRIGWYRAVANVYHAFAIQSFVAELAAAAGQDPKAFLLDLIGPPRTVDLTASVPKPSNYGADFKDHPVDTGRLRRVVEVAAEKAGWGRKLPPGRGLGIAAHRSFLTYVATVVEVQVGKDGRVHIPRVDTAVDCGFAGAPDRIKAQFEGAAVMGVSNALYGAVTAKGGRIEQSNFDDFPIARMDAAPHQTNVYLVESSHLPGGVGEPGVPPVAPALCNAIFAATGRRIRTLPIGDQLKGV